MKEATNINKTNENINQQNIDEQIMKRLRSNSENIIETAKTFLKKNLNIDVESNPIITINSQKILEAKKKYQITDSEKNILLGVGGSGPTKRISAEKFGSN